MDQDILPFSSQCQGKNKFIIKFNNILSYYNRTDIYLVATLFYNIKDQEIDRMYFQLQNEYLSILT